MNYKDFSDTKLKLKLGDKEVPLSFGIFARRRIQERDPQFDILTTTMPDFEIIPFLIQCAVEPEDQIWSTEKELFELYENCTDTESLQKIPLAFQNALGFTNRSFLPVIEKTNEMISSAKAELEKAKAKKK